MAMTPAIRSHGMPAGLSASTRLHRQGLGSGCRRRRVNASRLADRSSSMRSRLAGGVLITEPS